MLFRSPAAIGCSPVRLTCIYGYSCSTLTKPCILGVVVQSRYSAGKWQGPGWSPVSNRVDSGFPSLSTTFTCRLLPFLCHSAPFQVARLSGKSSPRVSSSDPSFTIVYNITLRLVVALTPSKSPSPSSLSISVMPWRVLRSMSMPALTADTRWS